MNEKIYSRLGEKIKFFRQRKSISQVELEIEAGISSGVLSRIESGKINPTKETILDIAEALDLNDMEISYLIGKLALPATEKEIDFALQEINGYFEKKNTLAYMIDDRSRIFALSKGFRLLAGISDNLMKEKIFGSTMAQIIIDDELGLRKFIDPDKYDKVVYHAFARNYQEMYFMKGDHYYNEMMNFINKDPIVKKYWEEFEKNPPRNVRSVETREVYFKYMKKNIKMLYVNDHLPSIPRFRVLDYRPANFLLRILSNLS